ncbi:MAG: hypothetical protein IBX46_12995 [Desulfuromonadales bacterium]|nr:hypothetical protein [Desulfuromonadales bacterium]
MKFFLVLLSVITLTACGSGGGDDENDPIVNEQRTLGDGTLISYALPAGTYSLEATSSGPNGLSVEWVGGASCINANEVLTYKNNCKLTMAGQLIISNPSTFGLGPSEIVTIKVW